MLCLGFISGCSTYICLFLQLNCYFSCYGTNKTQFHEINHNHNVLLFKIICFSFPVESVSEKLQCLEMPVVDCKPVKDVMAEQDPAEPYDNVFCAQVKDKEPGPVSCYDF